MTGGLPQFASRVGENVALAFNALRVAKMRSALTILGVVIGVSCVMAMASIVRGIQDQILNTLQIAGPTTFYVVKVFSQTPLNPENLPKWVRIRPDLAQAEANHIASLPEIQYAGLWGQILNRVEYGGVRTGIGIITGADEGYTEIYGGELTAGRWFTRSEIQSGAAAIVLDSDVAVKLFGQLNPLDKVVRVGGRPGRVVGIYEAASNIFEPPGQEQFAIVPFRMLDHQFTIDKTNALVIPVKPAPGVSVQDAQGAVTVAMPELRHLRPDQRRASQTEFGRPHIQPRGRYLGPGRQFHLRSHSWLQSTLPGLPTLGGFRFRAAPGAIELWHRVPKW